MLSPALALAAVVATTPAAALGATTPAAAAPSPSPVSSTAQPAPDLAPDAPPAAATPLAPRPDESMEFSVSYLGMKMGKVRLFVGKVESSVAPVFMQAQTSSVLAFITLRQQLASYLDTSTGLPRSASLDAVEGSYRHTDTVSFDRAASKAKVREKGKYDNTYLIDVKPDTLDFVALVWRLRHLPLAPGAKHTFSVLSGRDLRPVVAQVLGRERLKTKAGEFDTVKVQVPTGFTGQFSEKNPSHIWLTDDPRRVVVQIVSDFAIGHATASLTSYSPGAEPVPPPIAAEPAVEASAAPVPASLPATAEKDPAAVAKP